MLFVHAFREKEVEREEACAKYGNQYGRKENGKGGCFGKLVGV
jgi:hypothetical protein